MEAAAAPVAIVRATGAVSRVEVTRKVVWELVALIQSSVVGSGAAVADLHLRLRRTFVMMVAGATTRALLRILGRQETGRTRRREVVILVIVVPGRFLACRARCDCIPLILEHRRGKACGFESKIDSATGQCVSKITQV